MYISSESTQTIYERKELLFLLFTPKIYISLSELPSVFFAHKSQLAGPFIKTKCHREATIAIIPRSVLINRIHPCARRSLKKKSAWPREREHAVEFISDESHASSVNCRRRDVTTSSPCDASARGPRPYPFVDYGYITHGALPMN